MGDDILSERHSCFSKSKTSHYSHNKSANRPTFATKNSLGANDFIKINKQVQHLRSESVGSTLRRLLTTDKQTLNRNQSSGGIKRHYRNRESVILSQPQQSVTMRVKLAAMQTQFSLA